MAGQHPSGGHAPAFSLSRHLDNYPPGLGSNPAMAELADDASPEAWDPEAGLESVVEVLLSEADPGETEPDRTAQTAEPQGDASQNDAMDALANAAWNPAVEGLEVRRQLRHLAADLRERASGMKGMSLLTRMK